MAGDSDEEVNAHTHARIDPVIGAEVSGYKVVARIGNGGMGIVYEAEHAVIGKRVAIKVLRHEVADNPDVVQRLVAEARAVNQVGHRGIVDVFGFGTLPDGRQCIVMEYLEGEPLEDVLQNHVRTNRLLPVIDVLMILDEMLSALSAAHSAGVIHRDLKPSNVFLCLQRDGTKFVKLLDFGIAKLGVDVGLQSSIVIGTPTYMAPEQAAKGMVTPALDLYALGVMAFELLTGRPPFISDSPVGLFFMHAKDPPPKLTQLVGDLPVELETLIEQLLAKRPEARPQNAAVVRLELSRIRKMFPSSGSGLLSVEIQPPRPSQTNLPAVRSSQIPDPPRNSPPPQSSTQAFPSQPIAPPRATPSVPAELGRATDTQLSAPRPGQPNVGSATSSPSPEGRGPRGSSSASNEAKQLPQPKPSGSNDSLAGGADAVPAPSRRLLFAAVAILVVGGGIGVSVLSRAPTLEDPPIAVTPKRLDPPLALAPLAEDASVGFAERVQTSVGLADAAVVMVAEPAQTADASVGNVELGPERSDAGPRSRATSKQVGNPVPARLKRVEARLMLLARDPDQNVGIYLTQLKSLKTRAMTAKTPADFDIIDRSLRRLEADINDL